MAVLTDAKARSLKPEDKPLPHGGITGLALHPSTVKGRGKWVLRYVSPTTGKRRNAGLGSYPEISIAGAGGQARLMREQLVKGLDPIEVKREEASKPSLPSLEIAARLVHEQLLPGWRNTKHGKQWISTLEQYAFPLIGRQPIDTITPAHIASVLQPIWLLIPETATRVKQRLHAVMAWAWAHGFCQANPVDVVDKLLPQQPSKAIRTKHQPAMDWRALPAFYREHLANSERFDASRALLSFVILTACRSGEARNMRWEELDTQAAIWTIPADRMKTQVTHRVPLSPQAIAVLEKVRELHSEWVFPSPRKQIPLTDMAMTSLLRRLDAPSTTSGRIATAHGFRSSFRDWCSEQGYARDLAERALAHTVQNKVEAAYHRTDLLDLRRPMMEAWATFAISDSPTK